MDVSSSRSTKERNILQIADRILFGVSGRLPDSVLEHPMAVGPNHLDDLDVLWDLTVVSYWQTDGGLGHAAEVTTYRSANQRQGKRVLLAWLKENELEYRLLTDSTPD
jgi:hypothetical protein